MKRIDASTDDRTVTLADSTTISQTYINLLCEKIITINIQFILSNIPWSD